MSTKTLPPEHRNALGSEALRGLPRGVAQVYLQNNTLTGVLFLAGLFIFGPVAGMSALLGSAVGLATAALLRVPAERIGQGLYGFNAVLVALGAAGSFRPLWLTALVAVGGAVVATLLTHVAQYFLRVPAYTAPFVFTYWPLEYLHESRHWPSAPPPHSFLGLGIFASGAEVFLVTGLLPGLFILAGLAVSRWTLAVGAFAAALATYGIVQGLPLFPPNEITTGVYGFNAVLVTVGMLSTGRGWRSCVLAVPAVLLVQAGIEAVGLTPATFPFVLAMWCADLWRARSMHEE
ncbi:urea transporter [Streptomyces kebangsaanensis]|uniref:Urea transporter n=1 Tax=Streptomyces kebangsaanensis TaxID=864058 RepID=A0ABW6KM21_9ACTN